MVHLPSNIIKDFSDKTAYAQNCIEMWAQVLNIQEPFTPKALLSNLQLLFGLSQGYTKDASS